MLSVLFPGTRKKLSHEVRRSCETCEAFVSELGDCLSSTLLLTLDRLTGGRSSRLLFFKSCDRLIDSPCKPLADKLATCDLMQRVPLQRPP